MAALQININFSVPNSRPQAAAASGSMAWTATATLCCRLIRLPYARRPFPSRARCSAAQSPDAVDKEYADLNLRPLYPNVCNPSFFSSFLLLRISPLIHLCTQRGHHLRIRQHVNPLSSSFSVKSSRFHHFKIAKRAHAIIAFC